MIGEDPSREERLLHRAVERAANDEEWTELQEMGRHDPEVFARLASTLAADCRLSRAVDERLITADLVELPPSPPATARRVAAGAGWLLAAASLLLWLSPLGTHPGVPRSPVPGASPVAYTAELDELTLVSAEVVSELPRVMVQTEAADDGRYDIFYLRRILERVRVDEVRGLVLDEHGRPTPLPVSWPPTSITEEF